ncbi:MAG: GNAT family N-acetyltransferase [Bacteroidetes bacterium]|nr:GNAT family N-acetyltransferase [Bacteroidota bacterium]
MANAHNISILLKHYDELSKEELYALLHLRAEVFVVEQLCPFNDLDYVDQASFHILMYDENKLLIGHSRIVPPSKLYTEASIGRVVVKKSHRHLNLGKELMTFSIQKCKEMYASPIKIMAQFYLEKFYQTFGFTKKSEVFLEDDIEHIYMILD